MLSRPKHLHLRTLVLDSQNLTDHDVSPLFSVLHKTSVRSVSLRHNNVSSTSVHILARCILRLEVEEDRQHDFPTWQIFRVDLIGNNQIGISDAKILAAAILLRKQHTRRHQMSPSEDKTQCFVAQSYREFGVQNCAPIQILLGKIFHGSSSRNQFRHPPTQFSSVRHVWHHMIDTFQLPSALKEALRTDSANSSLTTGNFQTDAAVLGYLYSAGEARRQRLEQLNAEIARLLERLRNQRGATFGSMETQSRQLTDLIAEAKEVADQLKLTEASVYAADVPGLQELLEFDTEALSRKDTMNLPADHTGATPATVGGLPATNRENETSRHDKAHGHSHIEAQWVSRSSQQGENARGITPTNSSLDSQKRTAKKRSINDRLPFCSKDDAFDSSRDLAVSIHHLGDSQFEAKATVGTNTPAQELRLEFSDDDLDSHAVERSLALLDLAQSRTRFGAQEQRNFVERETFVHTHGDVDNPAKSAEHPDWMTVEPERLDSPAHFAAQEFYSANADDARVGADMASALADLAEQRLQGAR